MKKKYFIKTRKKTLKETKKNQSGSNGLYFTEEEAEKKATAMNIMLLENFPELEEEFKEQTDWMDGIRTGAHISYGWVLDPYLLQAIQSRNDEKTKQIFDFMESVLDLEDDYYTNVIVVTVIEVLFGSRAHAYYISFMGPKTELFYYDVGENFGLDEILSEEERSEVKKADNSIDKD